MHTTELPALSIGNLTFPYPIVQGGMGVKVSLARLSSAVSEAGGLGTISSVGLDSVVDEVRKAKRMTKAPIGVNVMCALGEYDDLVRQAVEGGADLIVSGAGLPLHLPGLVGDSDVKLVPIVSSARAIQLVLKTWHKRYNRTADAVVVEGALAGGHLGFSWDVLTGPHVPTLADLVSDVIAAVKPYETQYDCRIPVIAAGGIYSGQDIADMLGIGAAGVQMGTRFVCTDECDVDDAFKQAYLDSTEDDIVLVHSPVGMPGRAIRNDFVRRTENGEGFRIRCGYHCLRSCQRQDAPYCIADALTASAVGNLDEGLVFCGANAHRTTEIVPVAELMQELVTTAREALHESQPSAPRG